MGDQIHDIERKILNELWENYKNFRNVSTPPAEVTGQLPIEPTVGIQGKDLNDYLTNFLNTVWVPALYDESHCLFLDLCIWDPFRNDSPDNWALVGLGPNEQALDKEKARKNYKEMQDALTVYMSILNGEKVVAIDRRTDMGMQEILDAQKLGSDHVVVDENGKWVTLPRKEIRAEARERREDDTAGGDGGATKVVYDPLSDDAAKGAGKKINTFYLLYKTLKKDPFIIHLMSKATAVANRTSDPMLYQSTKKVQVNRYTRPEPVSRTRAGRDIPSDVERVIELVNLKSMYDDRDEKRDDEHGTLSTQLSRVVSAHLAFAPKRDRDPDRYVYYVPSLFYPKDAGTGIGGLVFISTHSFSDSTLARFQTILDSILSKIGVNYLFGNFYDQSVRSAISSIMARNMSHNIGSHVIPRATVSAVRRRLLELGLWPEDDKELTLVSALKGALDEYTQRKSDFLAEITTEPLMTTRPAFFYREVILPLVENTLLMDNIAANEGLRYRDGGKSNRLKVRVFINGNELMAVYKCRMCERSGDKAKRRAFPMYPDSLPYSLCCLDHNHKMVRLELKKIVNGDLDVEVELPGPLGEFALYSFLENYIRNVAKHNKASLSDDCDLEISIRLRDEDDGYYHVEIGNNLEDPSREVNISIDNKVYTSLQEALTRHLESPIILPDGSLKRQAWGLREMRICAVLLGGPKDFVRAVQGDKPVLPATAPGKTPRSSRDDSFLTVKLSDVEPRRLVYAFSMMKSKKMCAVLPTWPDDAAGEAGAARLQKEGIRIYRSLDELKEDLNHGQSIDSFRFAIFDCSEAAGKEGKLLASELAGGDAGVGPRLLPKFPFRILALTGEGGRPAGPFSKGVRVVAQDFEGSGLGRMSGGEMLQWAWREWLGRWLGDGPEASRAVVDIFLEQRAEEAPTRHWVEHARRFNGRSDAIKLRVYGKDEAHRSAPRDLCEVAGGRRDVHLIYDRHRGLRDVFEHQMGDRAEWSYAILEKLSPDFTMLFSPKFPTDPDGHWTLPWELAEAGLLRVLVIDERAAEFSLERLGGETEDVLSVLLRERARSPDLVSEALKWHLAWAAKIYVCTHFGAGKKPLELHDAVKRRGNAFPYLKVAVEEEKVGFELSVAGKVQPHLDVDAVLIHQGILDEYGREKDTWPTQSQLLETLRAHFPFVVVESGRGIPPNLSDHEKFLPFSRLQHSVLGESVGKFGLARTLMSLARRRERSRA